MSGGHWGYMSENIRDYGRFVANAMEVLAQIEHELDWGICGDTCLECARRRVVVALEAFFDDRLNDGGRMKALAILRDRKQNLCDLCARRRG